MKPIRLAAAAILLTFVSCTSVKYADRYGFLPGKDALANTEAFQRCLDGGGTIRVRKPGVYPVCRTPVDSIIVRDSRIGDSQIRILNAIDAPGMQYDTTLIRLEKVSRDRPDPVYCAPERPVRILED